MPGNGERSCLALHRLMNSTSPLGRGFRVSKGRVHAGRTILTFVGPPGWLSKRAAQFQQSCLRHADAVIRHADDDILFLDGGVNAHVDLSDVRPQTVIEAVFHQCLYDETDDVEHPGLR